MYVSVGPRTEEFDIVSSNHGRKKKCDFFVFDRKHPFWANLVKKKRKKKIKSVSVSGNLVLRLIRVCRIQWWRSLVPFLTRNTLFGWTWPKKNQNYQFKIKFGPKTNSNMQNSMVVFAFSVLDRKHPF